MHLQVLETIKQGPVIIPAAFILKFESWNTHRDCRRDSEGNIIQTRFLNAYLLASESLNDEFTIPIEFHYDLDLETDSPKTEQELYEFIQSKEAVEIVE